MNLNIPLLLVICGYLIFLITMITYIVKYFKMKEDENIDGAKDCLIIIIICIVGIIVLSLILLYNYLMVKKQTNLPQMETNKLENVESNNLESNNLPQMETNKLENNETPKIKKDKKTVSDTDSEEMKTVNSDE